MTDDLVERLKEFAPYDENIKEALARIEALERERDNLRLRVADQQEAANQMHRKTQLTRREALEEAARAAYDRRPSVDLQDPMCRLGFGLAGYEIAADIRALKEKDSTPPSQEP